MKYQQPALQEQSSVESIGLRLLRLVDSDWARWGAMLLWMALLFTLSSQARLPSLPQQDLFFKKTAHFCAYAVLVLLARRALHRQLHPSTLAWFVTVAYAVSDEWHQYFVPGRNPTVTDILIDAAGASCALLLWGLWSKRQIYSHRQKH